MAGDRAEVIRSESRDSDLRNEKYCANFNGKTSYWLVLLSRDLTKRKLRQPLLTAPYFF